MEYINWTKLTATTNVIYDLGIYGLILVPEIPQSTLTSSLSWTTVPKYPLDFLRKF